MNYIRIKCIECRAMNPKTAQYCIRAIAFILVTILIWFFIFSQFPNSNVNEKEPSAEVHHDELVSL